VQIKRIEKRKYLAIWYEKIKMGMIGGGKTLFGAIHRIAAIWTD
jgi:hypothetical protein